MKRARERRDSHASAQRRERPMAEIFWYFLKLGWLAFGGPLGQIGLMHLQVVERQKWLDEEEFILTSATCSPGRSSPIYIGYKRGGLGGGAIGR
jgi:chromate transporter